MNTNKDTDNEFYLSLLKKTELIYNRRVTKDFIPMFYSVAATPILRDKPILLGINWGGSGKGFEPQVSMPELDELTIGIKKGDYKFISKSGSFLKEYKQFDLEDINFNYSNLCYFRSQKEKDLTSKDYADCFPIFMEYLKYINPPFIISLGVNNVSRLKNIENSEIEVQKIFDSKNKFSGYKGYLQRIPFYGLPHPNARIPNDLRKEIWKRVFS